MADTSRCAKCGAEVHPGQSSEGLCPACLLRLALSAGRAAADEPPTLTGPGDSRDASGVTSHRLAPGQRFGHYRIERLLGKGGMGEVYEAEDLDSGRLLALKVLTHGLGGWAERARFLREGRLAASVSHPNTIYVYGTEEVETVPVIAMELAVGGTLKDRVKERGPLPPPQAVDAVLEVIAGLEAASGAGVLHRDVKPSNCFVDGEGVVKVGDFGLSISTLAREEVDLTSTGSFLGTPAFAAPEQLRCEDLDVRSDIYGVGATLYYLLAARAPFEGSNLLGLATRIAQDPPTPLRKLQPGIPDGLEEVVLRCLAKQPAERPADYVELTEALRPFGSAAPRPAALGPRFAAGVVDWFVVGLLVAPVSAGFLWAQSVGPTGAWWTGASPGPGALFQQIVYTLLTGIYFAVAESRWGSSVGKALCGLRVVGPEGPRPNFAGALIRGLLYATAFRLFYLISPANAPVYPPLSAHFGGPEPITAGFAFGGFRRHLGLLLLFVPARRRNGFAGLHDLWSRTLVARRLAPATRRRSVSSTDLVATATAAPRCGPYRIIDELGGTLFLGYDGKLRRRVWIEAHPAATAAIPTLRRDLARESRLRWLNGGRAPERSWDAYEAVDGKPLLAMAHEPQPWQSVRGWLLDLALELQAGLRDRSLPDLGLDRVWITPHDRAKLLEWRAPGLGEEAPAPALTSGEQVDLESAQLFLSSVSAFALGRSDASVDSKPPAHPVPLTARRFLERLGEGAFETSMDLVEALRTVVEAPACVSRRSRFVHLAICGAIPALFTIYVAPGVTSLIVWGLRHPDAARLIGCVQAHEVLEGAGGAVEGARSDSRGWHRNALEQLDLTELGFVADDVPRLLLALRTYIAGNRQFFERRAWEAPTPYRRWRTAAEQIVASRGDPTPDELVEATNLLETLLEERADYTDSIWFAALVPLLVPLWPLLWVGTASGLSAVFFRGGLLLQLLRIQIVTVAGLRASWARAATRGVVGSSPALAIGLLNLIDSDTSEWWFPVWGSAVLLSLSALIAGCVVSALHPARGLQERLTGTYLVPR